MCEDELPDDDDLWTSDDMCCLIGFLYFYKKGSEEDLVEGLDWMKDLESSWRARMIWDSLLPSLRWVVMDLLFPLSSRWVSFHFLVIYKWKIFYLILGLNDLHQVLVEDLWFQMYRCSIIPSWIIRIRVIISSSGSIFSSWFSISLIWISWDLVEVFSSEVRLFYCRRGFSSTISAIMGCKSSRWSISSSGRRWDRSSLLLA